mmetsp:Transcript_16326/g.33168  ORF Transcript_16326/g.33168 Transcript_16326/m.33168 type:complete len:107 (-) Transcript_16326:1318-1638(-)
MRVGLYGRPSLRLPRLPTFGQLDQSTPPRLHNLNHKTANTLQRQKRPFWSPSQSTNGRSAYKYTDRSAGNFVSLDTSPLVRAQTTRRNGGSSIHSVRQSLIDVSLF